MREDAAEQYLAYKLIDSNQDWKSKWFYVTNHHPELPKPSGKQAKHRPWWNTEPTMQEVSYGPPWAHYLGGYQDRLLGGPLVPDLCRTVPVGVRRKNYGGEVLG
jgi:hypothetical protein